MQNCTTVKQYADSEDGKKAIETAKEKAKDKETQEKVKEFIKEKSLLMEIQNNIGLLEIFKMSYCWTFISLFHLFYYINGQLALKKKALCFKTIAGCFRKTL